MNPGIEGAIDLRLHLADSRVERVSLVSSRRLDACRMLVGQPVEAAVRLLPNLFSVCGRAQAHAGLAAVEDALGLRAVGPHQAARRLLLLAETAEEHCWRLLLDWPRALGEKPQVEVLAGLRKPLAGLAEALYPGGDWRRPGGGRLAPGRAVLVEGLDRFAATVTAQVLGEAWYDPVDLDGLAWYAGHGGQAAARLLKWVLDRRLAGFGAADVGPLPALRREALSQAMAEDDGGFVAAPTWDGSVYQTGPLARQWSAPLVQAVRAEFGAGLLALLVARLVELAATLDEMGGLLVSVMAAPRGPEPSTAGGSGLGVVEAARGRLAHRVTVADGRIADYRILAPTEWNFHPEGLLARGLAGQAAGGLRDRAQLLVTALDPCVTCRVEIA